MGVDWAGWVVVGGAQLGGAARSPPRGGCIPPPPALSPARAVPAPPRISWALCVSGPSAGWQAHRRRAAAVLAGAAAVGGCNSGGGSRGTVTVAGTVSAAACPRSTSSATRCTRTHAGLGRRCIRAVPAAPGARARGRDGLAVCSGCAVCERARNDPCCNVTVATCDCRRDPARGPDDYSRLIACCILGALVVPGVPISAVAARADSHCCGSARLPQQPAATACSNRPPGCFGCGTARVFIELAPRLAVNHTR